MKRTLIVGDVHGCAEELASLVLLTRPKRLVLLGDLFTKGPDPAGVWKIIRAQEAEAILGNHDAWVLDAWGRDVGRKRAPISRAAFRWLAKRPLFVRGSGWVAVHAGIHPRRGPKGTPRRDAIAMRRFPSGGEGSPNPFWWELYSGPPLVVYGHDARRGLVDRRPDTLGLDTGCVYGGRLTGYLVEDDRVVSVPAARAYRSVKG